MPIVEPLPNTPLALDNNILSAWRHKQPDVVKAVTNYISRFKVPPALPAIVVFEIIEGFQHAIVKAGQTSDIMQRDLDAAQKLIQSCPILPFDSSVASIAAYVSGRLSRNISRKDLKDVFIAATALAYGYGIVTRNKKDFQLIATHLPIEHSILYLTNWNF